MYWLELCILTFCCPLFYNGKMAIRRLRNRFFRSTDFATDKSDFQEAEPAVESNVLEQEDIVSEDHTRIIERTASKGKKLHIKLVQRIAGMYSHGGADYNRVERFYRSLYSHNDDLGIEIPDILDSEGTGHKIVYESGSEMVPRIKVRDFDLFNIYLARLSRAITEHPEIPYGYGDVLYGIWSNATYEDFESPERFVRRVIEHMEDQTFAELDTNHVVALESMDNKAMHFQRTKNQPAYESPYDLTMALTAQSADKPFEENMLPSVRYGIETISDFTPEKRAYIYAVQDAPAMGTTEGLMKSSMETQSIKAARLLKEYTTWTYFYPNLMEEVFGEDLSVLLSSLEGANPEEAVVQLSGIISNKLVEETLNLSAFITQERVTEGIEPEILSKIVATIEELKKCGESVQRYKSMGEIFERRRANNAALKEAFSGGIPNSKKELRNVPPSRIVSMSAALAMMYAAGIREVKIPIFLPLRYEHKRKQLYNTSLKNSGEQIEKKPYEEREAEAELAEDTADGLYGNISDSLMRLAERVAFEIDGVEIVTLPDDTSYITLRLGKKDPNTGKEMPLSSNRLLLQEIIEKTGKLA